MYTWSQRVPDPGGDYLVQGGVPGPGGCTWSGGYLVQGGVPGQVLPPPLCGKNHRRL